MAKFKVGDTIKEKRCNETRIVTAVGRVNYLYDAPNGTEYVRGISHVDREYEKVEPFFEVGKAYWHRSGHTFQVTQVNTNSDGGRVAFGKVTWTDGTYDWTLRTEGSFEDWEQISK